MCVYVSREEEERQHEGERISQKVIKRGEYVSTKCDPQDDYGSNYLSEKDTYPGCLGSWYVVSGCHAIKPIAWLTGVFISSELWKSS